MMKRLGAALALFCIGAIAFWSPAIVLTALNSRPPSPLVLTILQPSILFLAYRSVLSVRRGHDLRISVAIAMLAGIWFLGYIGMTASLMFLGKPLCEPNERHPVLWLVVFTVVPIYTYIMATYYGSLGALIIVTVAMIYMHLQFERHNRVPPGRVA